MFNTSDTKMLLALARQSIEHFLTTGTKLSVNAKSIPKNLLEKRASFVTLTKDFELRGCVGHLTAIQPLYLDITENAYSAAFEDDRFLPLTKEELPQVVIEISILTPPRPLAFLSSQELLNKLTIGVDGVIISRGGKSATYLPQVWDEILDKKDFLSSLCLKAGLPPNDWQKPGIKISTYQVEIIQETTI